MKCGVNLAEDPSRGDYVVASSITFSTKEARDGVRRPSEGNAMVDAMCEIADCEETEVTKIQAGISSGVGFQEVLSVSAGGG